jgi:hypothetical protein
MADKFPRAYTSTVKQDDSVMEYVRFEKMGIGANMAGLPETASKGPLSLEHVGKSAGGQNAGNTKNKGRA